MSGLDVCMPPAGDPGPRVQDLLKLYVHNALGM